MLRWILKQLVLHACCCVDDNRLETAADFHFISIWKNTETINAIKWHPPSKVHACTYSCVFCRRIQTVKSFFSLSQFSLSPRPPRVLLLFRHQVYSCFFSRRSLTFCCTFTMRRSITVCSFLCVSVLFFFPACCAVLERVLLSLSLSVFLSADHSITLETCRQAARELHTSLRKTVMLYTTVSKRQ